MQYRMEPKDRKAHILAAALAVARTKGFQRMTRVAIACQAGITPALVTHHYTTMTQMRRVVMRAAVRQGIVEIVAYGLGVKDRHALKAPAELKQKAIDWMQSTRTDGGR